MEQVQKTSNKSTTKAPTEVEAKSRTPEQQELLDETADLLDEIDALLEPNAQAFIEGYVQKGGE